MRKCGNPKRKIPLQQQNQQQTNKQKQQKQQIISDIQIDLINIMSPIATGS
jgi:hypothetical protein